MATKSSIDLDTGDVVLGPDSLDWLRKQYEAHRDKADLHVLRVIQHETEMSRYRKLIEQVEQQGSAASSAADLRSVP